MSRRAMHRSCGDDDGFTMVAVLLTFLLVSGLALASMGYALNTVSQSRDSQDFRAALSAAQAGVQDYVSRLNTCDTYWDAPCGDSTPNLALGGWATVPGTSGTNAARYQQKLLSNPLSSLTPGAVRLQVTGEVNGVKRTIVADLNKTAFLKFLYYSDFETFSPTSTAGLSLAGARNVSVGSSRNYGSVEPFYFKKGISYTVLRATEDEVREGCSRYYYDGRDTFPRTVQWTESGKVKTGRVWLASSDSFPSGLGAFNVQCLTINFSGDDVIQGPLHTNDAITINGAVDFQGAATTSWKTSGQVRNPSDPNKLWVNNQYTPRSNLPKYKDKLPMPPTNQNIRRLADASLGGSGCLYTGPTSIEFQSDGTLKVKSPYTKSTNAGCIGGNPSVATAVSGPANGVIYVQDVPASSTDPNYRTACGTAQVLPEYTQNTGDDDHYNCSRGDAFVQGTVKGKFTVATAHDVVVVGNVKYDGGLGSRNVLGLVAQNNVEVYHPVNERVRLVNLRIDAAIASVSNSFTVQNYDVGSSMGDLTVNGVIVQKFRGPVGTSGGSGYDKAYKYDNRLTALPPPSFLELQNDAWSSTGFSEEKAS